MTRRKDPNSRTGQLRAIIRQNPELTNTEIALLTDEPANLVSVARVSMRAKKKNKPVKVVYEKKTTPLIDAVSGPEEEEAFKQLEANSLQVGGSHYRDKAIQPWDYIASNNIGYLEGNIVKYVSRWQAKGGLEDLKKAQHYLTKLIEVNS
tara:strand:- start:292 stop:741 length:450 start_codon:yes stop_codon:yes gene_type:complete